MMEAQTKKILLIIIAISVLLRVGVAIYLGNTVEEMPGIADQVSYHTLALRVLDGHGLTFPQEWWPATAPGQPTAHWSYLYTGYLILVYAIFGPQPLVARILQAVLVGILQPLLIFALGRRLFGRTAGLVAAGLLAVYAYFIYYSGALMTESFYITAILTSFYLAFRLLNIPPIGFERASNSQHGRFHWMTALTLGLALGAAVLLRQLFLLFIPFLLLWILLAGRRNLPAVLISGIVVVALILPFTAYNYDRFHRFVLLNTNAGFAFFWGNHPIYGDRFIPILDSSEYHKLIPPELLTLDEAALDQELLHRGIGFVTADPGRYVRLSFSRIPPYFAFWPAEDSGLISNLSRMGSFGLLWPFMLYGLLLSLFRRPSIFQLHPASPRLIIFVFILVYTGIHVLTWTLIRYRLPVDAVGLLLAGYAFVDLFERVPVLRRLSSTRRKSHEYV